MDTCLRNQSLRAAASCPTGKLAGVLRFSKRRQLDGPHGRLFALQELFVHAGDVSPHALPPRERPLLEFAARGFIFEGQRPGARAGSLAPRTRRPITGGRDGGWPTMGTTQAGDPYRPQGAE